MTSASRYTHMHARCMYPAVTPCQRRALTPDLLIPLSVNQSAQCPLNAGEIAAVWVLLTCVRCSTEPRPNEKEVRRWQPRNTPARKP